MNSSMIPTEMARSSFVSNTQQGCSLNYFASYARSRYQTDSEFRKKNIEHAKQYRQNLKEEQYEEFAHQNRKKSNRCYQTNQAYRERQKERALARYYRLKHEKLMVLTPTSA